MVVPAVAIGTVLTMLAVPVTAVVTPPQRSNDAAAQSGTGNQHDADSGKMANETHQGSPW